MDVKDETSSSEEYKTNPYKSDNENEDISVVLATQLKNSKGIQNKKLYKKKGNGRVYFHTLEGYKSNF